MRTVRSSGRIQGWCLVPGGSLCSGGVSLPRGGFSLPGGGLLARGGSGPGGSPCRGGLVPGWCLLRVGGYPIMHWGRQPPPCGQTDACKNITFATSLRTVNITNTVANRRSMWLWPYQGYAITQIVLSDTLALFAQGVDHERIARILRCPRGAKYRTFTSSDINVCNSCFA